MLWLWLKRALIEIHTKIFTDQMKNKYKKCLRESFAGEKHNAWLRTWQLRAMCLLCRQRLKGNHYLGGLSKGSGSGSQHSMFRKLFLYTKLWGLDWNYPSLPVYSFIVRRFISSGRNNYICYPGHYLCNIRVPGKLIGNQKVS